MLIDIKEPLATSSRLTSLHWARRLPCVHRHASRRRWRRRTADAIEGLTCLKARLGASPTLNMHDWPGIRAV
ncbi:hypothetical protein DBB29_15855 [Pandoraea cepalis]|uniref:Uncharacterized protein n=1 Tax=Pandoraea cepalis TaxID=2508294 RepID=A0AAW7MN50_9BURK|nr:hypothetical protein [Pandoraea cepalis]MDN4579589.1 hypothetical protein [Pandoraea cepalis]